MSVGMAQEGPHGLQPLSWTEIHAFSQLTGEIQSGWEAGVIRSMSFAYVDGRRVGNDEFGIEPWVSNP